MGIRRKVIAGSGMLMGGQILSQTCGFVRNVVVARMLTPEDFGIAATLAIAMSMFGMVGNLAVDRILVQAEDGDNPAFQATAHLFQVMRGVGLALALFLMAWPLSLLFDLPQALWAFQFVALVPLIRGFVHLDPKRLQRELGFTASILTDLLPQIILVLVAWPVTWWFRDYSAMVWLLILQVVVGVVMSHVVAKRKYAWAWNRKFLNQMYAFGWPLMLNGLLLFLIFQGDRMIVGSAYDMATLGIYSVAFSITFVPSTMITQVASSLLLPVLSNVRGDFRKFTEYYTFSICVLCLAGIAVSTGFILLGQQVILLTYGSKYADVKTFIGWMAIMQMVRVLRVGPTIASMAWGDTRTPLRSNFGRISVFPAAIWIGLAGEPLKWIVIMGCLGEIIALAMLLSNLHRSRGLAARYTLKPSLIAAGAVAMAYVVLLFFDQPHYYWIFYPLTLLCIVSGASLAMVYCLPSGWSQLAQILQYRMPQANLK